MTWGASVRPPDTRGIGALGSTRRRGGADRQDGTPLTSSWDGREWERGGKRRRFSVVGPMSFRPRVQNVLPEKLWGRAGHVTAHARGPPLVAARLSAGRAVSWGADVTESNVLGLRIPGVPMRRLPSDHPRARATLEMEIR